MIALARDFDVFATGIATGFSAILFSIWDVAQAGYVCALPVLHHASFPSFPGRSPALRIVRFLRRRTRSAKRVNSGESVPSVWYLRYPGGLHAALQTGLAASEWIFKGLRPAENRSPGSSVGRLIARQ